MSVASHRTFFPAWSTQPWYPQALELSGEVSIKLGPYLTNLILPQDKATVLPLAEKLTLYIIKIWHNNHNTLWLIKCK